MQYRTLHWLRPLQQPLSLLRRPDGADGRDSSVFWKIASAPKAPCGGCMGRCRSQPFAAKERYGCGSAACRCTLPRQDAPFFTKLRGEFITSQRADVGIGPYKRIGMSLRIRRGFFNKSTASRRAEQSPAPTNYGWLTRSNKERSCHALDAA